MYAAWNVSDRLKLGLGINSPFGLKTNYNQNWVGRYYAIDSELTTININPTVAAKLTDNLSVGAGINLQYAKAKLSNAIDFGLIGFSNRLPTRPLSPRLAATADITWTGWSRFEELRVKFDNPLEPDNVQQENWHNTFRYSLGFNYTLSNAWQLRAGIAYDPSPADEEYITSRIPDSNRTWLAIGASFKATDSLSFDIGYAHLFVDDTEINQVSITNGNLTGKFDNHVDIIGLQLNWMF